MLEQYYCAGYNKKIKNHQIFTTVLLHLFYITTQEICFYIAQCSKFRKKVQFQKNKNTFFTILKWLKINFCTRKKFKTTKNAILRLFSGAKIDFLPFLKMQIMFFCTFEICTFEVSYIFINQILYLKKIKINK